MTDHCLFLRGTFETQPYSCLEEILNLGPNRARSQGIKGIISHDIEKWCNLKRIDFYRTGFVWNDTFVKKNWANGRLFFTG